MHGDHAFKFFFTCQESELYKSPVIGYWRGFAMFQNQLVRSFVNDTHRVVHSDLHMEVLKYIRVSEIVEVLSRFSSEKQSCTLEGTKLFFFFFFLTVATLSKT